MTKIFLIRHAEAEGNIHRRAHGHFNGLVTVNGYRQIEQLKERFLSEKIDAVYSSDLSRTSVTASAICEPHGLPLQATEQLREISLGAWEDMPWGDIRFNEPAKCEHFNNDPARWSVDGSEGYEHIKDRMSNCIMEIARRHDGGAVCVFSHGVAIRSYLCKIMGVQSHEISKVPYCDNTAVTLIRYEGSEPTIEYRGDNSHLTSESSTLGNQTWWREKKDWLREDLRYAALDDPQPQGSNTSYSAYMDNDRAGLLRLDPEKDKEHGVGWLDHIFLEPKYRGRGFAIQLVGQAISEYRKRGREKLRLAAPSDNPVSFLCQKHGFKNIDSAGAVNVYEKYIRN